MASRPVREVGHGKREGGDKPLPYNGWCSDNVVQQYKRSVCPTEVGEALVASRPVREVGHGKREGGDKPLPYIGWCSDNVVQQYKRSVCPTEVGEALVASRPEIDARAVSR